MVYMVYISALGDFPVGPVLLLRFVLTILPVAQWVLFSCLNKAATFITRPILQLVLPLSPL